MRIKDQDGTWTQYKGLDGDTLAELTQRTTECLANRPYVLISIIGNKGIGKSLLGKYFRRAGIGSFRPRQIAVIDDDNMAVDFLFFFRRWNAIPCSGVDELAPFYHLCARKPVRIYIKSNPESRITRADIVLLLTVDEKTRKQRLIKRYGSPKGETVTLATREYDPGPKIAYQHLIAASL